MSDTSDSGSSFWRLFVRLMEERKLNQKQVAEALGISRQAIQAWRTKPTVEPRRANVLALAKLFRVKPKVLFDAIDADSTEGVVLSRAAWRMFVTHYVRGPAGKDTPGPIVERILRAPHADFADRLIHSMRVEFEREEKAKTRKR